MFSILGLYTYIYIYIYIYKIYIHRNFYIPRHSQTHAGGVRVSVVGKSVRGRSKILVDDVDAVAHRVSSVYNVKSYSTIHAGDAYR